MSNFPGSPLVPGPAFPGIFTKRTMAYRKVTVANEMFFAGGITLDGTKVNEDVATPYVYELSAGHLLGIITASGQFGSSIIGLSGGALTNTGTTLTTTAAIATELVRRIGATGTFKLTGPPTAAGTVRSATITYSAVNTTTGDVTITAAGINEVQTVIFGAAATGGTVRIGFTIGGAVVWTDTAAWSATDATFLSNINTAIDNLLGAGLVVATARSAVDTDLGFVLTFSGAGYTALPQTLVEIDASALTSVTTVTVTRTTAGQDGRFVTASLIQPTDGSENIRTFLGNGYPTRVSNFDGTRLSIPISSAVVQAEVIATNLINWPADASLRTYVKAALNTYGKYIFREDFIP